MEPRYRDCWEYVSNVCPRADRCCYVTPRDRGEWKCWLLPPVSETLSYDHYTVDICSNKAFFFFPSRKIHFVTANTFITIFLKFCRLLFFSLDTNETVHRCDHRSRVHLAPFMTDSIQLRRRDCVETPEV